MRTTRIKTLELRVPYDDYSEEKNALVETLVSENKVIIEHKASIDRIKAAMKPHVEAMEKAVHELTVGRPALVPCRETIDWDAGTVAVYRCDTDELIQTRGITERDRQADIDDTTEEYQRPENAPLSVEDDENVVN